MNEITRSIDTVTAEIIVIRDNARRTFFQAVIEIGRRLEEAKEMVPQGGWLDYLQNVLGFKPSTAQNYMRIAREFGGGQIALDGTSTAALFGELGYSQLVPLLGLSADERKQLAADNDLPEMSSREIKKLVDDYKAAQAATAHAERRAEEAAEAARKAEKSAAEEKEKADDAAAARAAAAEKTAELEGRVEELLRQLKEKPIEAHAEVVPDEEVMERARAEIRAETEAEIRAAQERAAAASAALEQAKNPAVHQVNFLFGEMRDLSARLGAAFGKLRESQPETAGKFGGVIGAWLAEEAVNWNF